MNKLLGRHLHLALKHSAEVLHIIDAAGIGNGLYVGLRNGIEKSRFCKIKRHKRCFTAKNIILRADEKQAKKRIFCYKLKHQQCFFLIFCFFLEKLVLFHTFAEEKAAKRKATKTEAKAAKTAAKATKTVAKAAKRAAKATYTTAKAINRQREAEKRKRKAVKNKT